MVERIKNDAKAGKIRENRRRMKGKLLTTAFVGRYSANPGYTGTMLGVVRYARCDIDRKYIPAISVRRTSALNVKY